MTTILSRAEAAVVLRVSVDDEVLFDLLAQVDEYIKRATGMDWGNMTTIPVAAKNAARMLLVKWYEDPGGMTAHESSLGFGLRAALVQLEVEARKYHTFEGLNGAGYLTLDGVKAGESVVSVTGLVGVTGDQASKFETTISYDGLIQQTSSSDLDDCWFRAYVKPLEDM